MQLHQSIYTVFMYILYCSLFTGTKVMGKLIMKHSEEITDNTIQCVPLLKNAAVDLKRDLGLSISENDMARLLL